MDEKNINRWKELKRKSLKETTIFSYIISLMLLGMVLIKFVFGTDEDFIYYNMFNIIIFLIFLLVIYLVLKYFQKQDMLAKPSQGNYMLLFVYITFITITIAFSFGQTNYDKDFIKVLYFIPVILSSINYKRLFGYLSAFYTSLNIVFLDIYFHDFNNFDLDIIIFILFFWVVWIISGFVSLEKEIQNQLEKEKMTNEDRLESMGSLVATTVHDIRNPLSIIRAIGQLGVVKSQDENERQYFKRIIQQTGNLSDMLDNILYVHQPEKFILVSPGEVIAELIDGLKPLCETRNIELIFNNNTTEKTSLRIKLFKRAIDNLVINAIKSMNNNGKIEVNINKNADKILISITDNGPGIPAEIQEELFRPFVKNREDGTGLGLYIVYQAITEVHKGEIWFDTKKGKGTTFFIELNIEE